MMRNKGGHGLQARITIDDIPQAQLDLLNSSTVTYEIRDAITGLVESSVTRPMRSLTANFLRLLWGRMTGTACIGGLDINDTAIDESSGKATNLKCVGATTGLKKFGICIGTGTGAVAQTDNKLTWDTGFTTYGATTRKTATTISGSEIYFEIQKQFVNTTGSTRTIYEAGLCTTGEGTEADNNTNVLIAREITNGATGTAVATGKTLTVVFKISSTFTTDGTINKTFMRELEVGFLGTYAWEKSNAAPGFNGRNGASILYFSGYFWLIGGNENGTTVSDGVWKSADFKTWSSVRANGAANGFGGRRNHSAAVMVDPADSVEKMWVIGGYTTSNVNDVWVSTDGATWTRKRADGAANGFTACRLHGTTVYNSKLWVAGGLGGAALDDVFSSTDGITWTAVTTSASFGALYVMANLVTLNGTMYLMDGDNQKVYSSTDGVTWTTLTTTPGWGGVRSGMSSIVWGEYIVIIGGRTAAAGTYHDDVYASKDGIVWTKVFDAIGLGGYSYNGCFATDGKIMGNTCGSNVTPAYTDDCWRVLFGIFGLSTGATPDHARIDAASGAVYGITAGTGTTNFAGTDAALVTPIADGSGASQLDYGDMTDAGRLSEPTVSGSDNVMRLERDFTNNSGGSITIKEVGLSAKGLDALGLLLMRGKVDKAVADGASVRVAIELETTV